MRAQRAARGIWGFAPIGTSAPLERELPAVLTTELTRKVASLESDNAQLREENVRLRAALQLLGSATPTPTEVFTQSVRTT